MEDEKVVEIIEEGEGQRCLGCALYLPLEKFGKMRKKKNGKNPRCFECQRELSSTRREKYKDKIRERSRVYNKKKYEKIKQVQEEHQELTARDQEIKNNEEKSIMRFSHINK